MRTKEMILCAVFAAVLCVFSVVAVPVGTIPVTLGVLGVLLCAVILGRKCSFIATVIFILLGAAGLPVFSGMQGGVQVLLGPTGGYIWAYPVMGLLAGTAVKRQKHWLIVCLVCIVSVCVCYLLGTAQFVLVTRKTWQQALVLCVYPFLLPDMVKCVLAAWLGTQIRRRLHQSGVL